MPGIRQKLSDLKGLLDVSLSISRRMDRSVAVVGLAGEMDYANAGQLTTALRGVLEEGHRETVLDLGQLDFLDSGGLGAVVAGWKAANAAGGSLHLVCDRKHLLQLLGITGLINVFNVHPTLAAYFSAISPAADDSSASVQQAG